MDTRKRFTPEEKVKILREIVEDVFVIMLIIGFSVEAQQNQLPNIEITTDNVPKWFEDSRSEDKIWGIGIGRLLIFTKPTTHDSIET